MNRFGFLFVKKGARWIRCAGAITSGSYAIKSPGIYKVNTRTNGWWGTPHIFEITAEDIKLATHANGIGEHGYGIEVSPFCSYNEQD